MIRSTKHMPRIVTSSYHKQIANRLQPQTWILMKIIKMKNWGQTSWQVCHWYPIYLFCLRKHLIFYTTLICQTTKLTWQNEGRWSLLGLSTITLSVNKDASRSCSRLLGILLSKPPTQPQKSLRPIQPLNHFI